MRVTPLLVALACSVSALAAEDVVLLTNGQRLIGTIDHEAKERPGSIAIKTANGTLRIRTDLVAYVEESYETRLAGVNKKDPKALTDLAWWCHGKGLDAEALQLLVLVRSLPNPPIEALGLYADLVDLQGRSAEALDLLIAYRAAGGTDPQLLMRLKELEDAKLAFVRDQIMPAPKSTAPAVADGLEARGWSSESNQWSNTITANTLTLDGEKGTNQVIEVTFEKGDKDKAAIKRSLRGQTIGDNSEVALYVFNKTGKPVRIAVALKTGNWAFHESMPVQVPGAEAWQEVRFDLKGTTWKSEASNWAHTAAVNELSDLKELQILIYNGKNESGSVLIDAIDFAKPQNL
jgi:hypothetical protein